MEPNPGDTVVPPSTDSNEDAEDNVAVGSKSEVIKEILSGKEKKYEEKDMEEIHNHWMKCRK